MRTRLRRVLPAAAAAALLCPAGAVAQSWSPAATIVTGPGYQDLLQLSSLRDGSLLSTWWTRGATAGSYRYAARPPGGAWSGSRALGASVVSAPAALGGNRVLLISGGDPGTGNRVRALTGTASAPATRRVTIGRDNWGVPLAAADDAGRAVGAWTWAQPRRGSGSNLRPRVVVVAARSASGRWGAPRRISPLPPPPPYGNERGPRLSATAAAVAAGGHGTVVVAWQRVGRIEARISRDGGRTFGAVTRLGSSTFGFPRIGVAVSGRGDVAVGWSTAPRVQGGRSLRSLLAVARPGRGFARTRELSRGTATQAAIDPAAGQFGPRVVLAYGAAGVGYAAWQSGEGDHVGVRVARFSAVSAPSGRLFLPDGDARTAVLSDAAAAGAGAVVSWADVGPAGQARAVRAVTWAGDGSLRTPMTLGTGSAPQVAFAGAAPHAVWLSGAAGAWTIRTVSAPAP